MSSILVLVALSLNPAQAQDSVTVKFVSLNTSQGLTYTRNGTARSATAGEFNLLIDGVTTEAYCVDLDHTISFGATYSATPTPVGNEDPWCAVNYIVSNYEATSNTEGAAIQGAIWTLIYEDEGFEVTGPAATAARTAEILDESDGTCPLNCLTDVVFDATVTPASDGLVYIDVVVTQDGVAAGGQVLEVSTSVGSLVEPADGQALVDGGGTATIVLDPGGASDATVSFSADGQTLYQLVPDVSVQQLLAFSTDECSWSGSADFLAPPLGTPRTIGFWKHQFSTATGGKGNQHVDNATLESFLPMDVFDLSITTLQEGYDALWIKKASMQERALQQCFATQLNLAWGEVGWFSQVDLDGDGVNDGAFWELWADAEAAYNSGDYESAKTTCDTFNNL